MRRFPSSWSTVLTQLGFKRKRAKRSDERGRKSRIESLEMRAMLAADVYTVTTFADQSDGVETDGLSLREAIVKAETDGATDDNDVIRFDPALFADGPGTILLGDADGSGAIDAGETASQLAIDSDLTISGPGADLLTISGGDATRIIRAYSGNHITLADLTIAEGHVTDWYGGAIYTQADMTLEQVVIRDSEAVSGSFNNFEGGGIASFDAPLTIRSSTIEDNYGRHGGGIFFSNRNAGGNNLTIEGTTIAGNYASSHGGGLYVYDFGTTASEVSITNSTLSGNSGWLGGAIATSGSPEIDILHSTITDNYGRQTRGGIWNLDNGNGQAVITLQNSIVAGNDAAGGTTTKDLEGPVEVASSHNLIGQHANTGLNESINEIIASADPGLTGLGDFGGPTQTHALLPNSPARDQGDNTIAESLVHDQRGGRNTSALRINNGSVDIGATEFETVVIESPIRTDLTIGTPFQVFIDEEDDGQSAPWVATNSNGQSVVVWQSDGPEGEGVYVQLISSSDATSLPRLVDLGQSELEASYLQSAIDGEGNYSIIWRGADDATSDIYLRRYSADGAPIDLLPVNVSQGTDRGAYATSIVSNSAGRIVVTWQNPEDDLMYRRYSSTGLSLDGGPRVGVQAGDDFLRLNKSRRYVAVAEGGEFYLVWGVGYHNIYLKKFNADGSVAESKQEVASGSNYDFFPDEDATTITDSRVFPHDINVDSSGNLAFTWLHDVDTELDPEYSYGQDREYRLLLRRHDVQAGWQDSLLVADGHDLYGAGVPGGTEISTIALKSPGLAIDEHGRAGVAWRQFYKEVVTNGQTTTGPGEWSDLAIRWLDSSGVIGDLQGHRFGTAQQDAYAPSLAVDAAGNFLLTGVAEERIFAQRFHLPQLLSVDNAGVLTIDNSIMSEDNIKIASRIVDGERRVTLNGVASPFLAGDVTKIVIHAGDNDNHIDVSQVTRASFPGLFGDPNNPDSQTETIDIFAGAGDDTIIGSPLNDYLFGNGGSDRILGKGGNDTLDGGDGEDLLFGGDGDDELYGRAGKDTLLGEGGNDDLFGGEDNDRLDGGIGSDLLQGEAGDDRLDGGQRPDDLTIEADTLDGGAGDDTYLITDASALSVTVQDSEGGIDTIDLSGASVGATLNLSATTFSGYFNEGVSPSITLNAANQIENAIGTSHNDTLTGNQLNNHLEGGSGDDTLTIGGGVDFLAGGLGDDIYKLVEVAAGSTVQLFDTGSGDGGNEGDTLDVSNHTDKVVELDTPLDQQLGSVLLLAAGIGEIEKLAGEEAASVATNTPPTLSVTRNHTVDNNDNATAATLIQYTIDVADADGDAVDLVFDNGLTSTSLAGHTESLDLTQNGSSWTFDWRHTNGEPEGKFTVRIYARENSSTEPSAMESITFQIGADPIVPELDLSVLPATNETIAENGLWEAPLQLTNAAAIPAADSVTFSLGADAPAGLIIGTDGSSTPQLEWTPAPGQEGEHNFTIHATRSGATVIRNSFDVTLTVADSTAEPVITPGSLKLVFDTDNDPTNNDPDDSDGVTGDATVEGEVTFHNPLGLVDVKITYTNYNAAGATDDVSNTDYVTIDIDPDDNTRGTFRYRPSRFDLENLLEDPSNGGLLSSADFEVTATPRWWDGTGYTSGNATTETLSVGGNNFFTFDSTTTGQDDAQIAELRLVNDTGVDEPEGNTNPNAEKTTDPTLTGNVTNDGPVDDLTVRFYVGGTGPEHEIGRVKTDADGHFDFTPDAADVAVGMVTITAKVEERGPLDRIGDPSFFSTLTIDFEMVADSAPTISTFKLKNNAGAIEDNLAYDPTLTGTITDGDAGTIEGVTIEFSRDTNFQSVEGIAVTDELGQFIYVPGDLTPDDVNGPDPEDVTVYARAVQWDEYRNGLLVGGSTSKTFTYREAPNNAPEVTSASLEYEIDPNQSPGQAVDPTITGTATKDDVPQAGIFVEYSIDVAFDTTEFIAADGFVVTGENGEFEFTPAGIELGELQTVYIRAADWDGDRATGEEWKRQTQEIKTVSVELVAPQSPTVTAALAFDTGADNTDKVTTDPTIIGTVTYEGDMADVTVEYDLDNDDVVDGQVTPDGDGNYQITFGLEELTDSTGQTLQPGDFGNLVRVRAVVPDRTARPDFDQDNLLGIDNEDDVTAGQYADLYDFANGTENHAAAQAWFDEVLAADGVGLSDTGAWNNSGFDRNWDGLFATKASDWQDVEVTIDTTAATDSSAVVVAITEPPVGKDPEFSGTLTVHAQTAAGRTIEFYLNGAAEADGATVTDANGKFTYTPQVYKASNALIIKLVEPVYGSNEPNQIEVYNQADAFTVEIDTDLTVSLDLANPLTDDTPPTAIEGKVTGQISALGDLALQTVEFDFNGDGVPDSSTLTDGLGGFEFTPGPDSIDDSTGADIVSVRARLVRTEFVLAESDDTESRSYRTIGAWSDAVSWEVQAKALPSIENFELEQDTGHYDLGYDLRDGVTSNPALIGLVTAGGAAAAYQLVEFDHDGDGRVDGTTSTDANGRFRYEPADLELGYHDIRARVPDHDATTGVEAPVPWAQFTRSGDPSDAGTLGGGFTLVSADAVQVTEINWLHPTNNNDPTVTGTVAWAVTGDPGAAGVVVSFTDQGGNSVGSTVTANDGTFEFTPIGLDLDTAIQITAEPVQSPQFDSALVTPPPNNGAKTTGSSKGFVAGSNTSLLNVNNTHVDFLTAELRGEWDPGGTVAPQYIEVRIGGAGGATYAASVQALADGSTDTVVEFAHELSLSDIAGATVEIRAVGYDANGYLFGNWETVSNLPDAPVLSLVGAAVPATVFSVPTDPADASIDYVATATLDVTTPTQFNSQTIEWQYEVEYDLDGDGEVDQTYVVEDPSQAIDHTLEGAAPDEFDFRARVVGYGTFDEIASAGSAGSADDVVVERTLRAEGAWIDASVTFLNPAPTVEVDTIAEPVTEATITGTVESELRSTPGMTVEVDLNLDGAADATALVLAGGAFEYTVRDARLGENEIQVRAIDPYSDAEPLVGAWEPVTFTLVPHELPPIASLSLEGYEEVSGGLDRTADPTIVGTIDFSSLPQATLRWIEFDHDGDGLVDGAATVDAAGEFRYAPDDLPLGPITSLAARAAAQVGSQLITGEWSQDYTTAPVDLDFLHEPNDLPEITGVLEITDAERGVVVGRMTRGGFGYSGRLQIDVMVGMDGDTAQFNGTAQADSTGRFEYELRELVDIEGDHTIRATALLADPNEIVDPNLTEPTAADGYLAGYYAGASRTVDFNYTPVALPATPILLSSFDLAYDTGTVAGETADPMLKGQVDLAAHNLDVAPPQLYVEIDYDDTGGGAFNADATVAVRADGSFEFTPQGLGDPNATSTTHNFRTRTKVWNPDELVAAYQFSDSGGGGVASKTVTLAASQYEAPTIDSLHLKFNKAETGVEQSADPAFRGRILKTNSGRLGGLVVQFDHNGDGEIDGTTITNSEGKFFYRAVGLEPSNLLTQTITAWVIEEDYWGASHSSEAKTLDFILTRAPLVESIEFDASVGPDGAVTGSLFSEVATTDLWVEYELFGAGLDTGAAPADLAEYQSNGTSDRLFASVQSDGSFTISLPAELTGAATVVLRGVDTSAISGFDPNDVDPIDYQTDALPGPWQLSQFNVDASTTAPDVFSLELVEDTGQANDDVTTNPAVKGVTTPFTIVEITTRKQSNPGTSGFDIEVAVDRITSDHEGKFEFASPSLASESYGETFEVVANAITFDPDTGAEIDGTDSDLVQFTYVANGTTLAFATAQNNPEREAAGLIKGQVTANQTDGRVAGLRVELDIDNGNGFDDVADAFAITDANGDFEYQLFGVLSGQTVNVRARVIEWDPVSQAFTEPPFDDSQLDDPAVDATSFTLSADTPTEPQLAPQVTDDLVGQGQADAALRAAVLDVLALSNLSASAGAIDIGAGQAAILQQGGIEAAGPDSEESLTALSLTADWPDPASVSNPNAISNDTIDADGRSFDYHVSGHIQTIDIDANDVARLTTVFAVTISNFTWDPATGATDESLELGSAFYSFTFTATGDASDPSNIEWTNHSSTETLGYDFHWTRTESLAPGEAPYLTETIAGTYKLHYSEQTQSIQSVADVEQDFYYTETIHIESWLDRFDPNPPEGSSLSVSEHSVYDEKTTNNGLITNEAGSGGVAEGTLSVQASGVFDSEINSSYSQVEHFDDGGFESSSDHLTEFLHYDGQLDLSFEYITGELIEGDFALTETIASSFVQGGSGTYQYGDVGVGDGGSWHYSAEGTGTTSSTLVGDFYEDATTDTLDATLDANTNIQILGEGGGSGAYGDHTATENYDHGQTTSSYTFTIAASASLNATLTASGDDYSVGGDQSTTASATVTTSGTVTGSSNTTTGEGDDQVTTDVTYEARLRSQATSSASVDADFSYSSVGDATASGEFNLSSNAGGVTASQAYGTTVEADGTTSPFRENETTEVGFAFGADGTFTAEVRPGERDRRHTEGNATRSENATRRTTSYAGTAGPIEALSLGPDGGVGSGELPTSIENFTLTKTTATTRDEEDFDFQITDGATNRNGTFTSDENVTVENLSAFKFVEQTDDQLQSLTYRSDSRASSQSTTEGSFRETSGNSGTTRTADAAVDEVFNTYSHEETIYRARGSETSNPNPTETDSYENTEWTVKSALTVEAASESTSSGVVGIDGDEVTTSAIDVAFTSEGRVHSLDKSTSSTIGQTVEGDPQNGGTTTKFQTSSQGRDLARLNTSSESEGVVQPDGGSVMDVNTLERGRIKGRFTTTAQEQITGGADYKEESTTDAVTLTRGRQTAAAEGTVTTPATPLTSDASPSPSRPTSTFHIDSQSTGASTTTSNWQTSYEQAQPGNEHTRGGSHGERIDSASNTETVNAVVITDTDGRTRELGTVTASSDANVRINGDYHENSNLGGRTSYRSGPIEADEGVASSISGSFTTNHGNTEFDFAEPTVTQHGRREITDKHGWRTTSAPAETSGVGGGGPETIIFNGPTDGTIEGEDNEVKTSAGFGEPTKLDTKHERFRHNRAGDSFDKFDGKEGTSYSFAFTVGGTTTQVDLYYRDNTYLSIKDNETVTNHSDPDLTPLTNKMLDIRFVEDKETSVRIATNDGQRETLTSKSQSQYEDRTEDVTLKKGHESSSLYVDSIVVASSGSKRTASQSYNSSHELGVLGAVGGEFTAKENEHTNTWNRTIVDSYEVLEKEFFDEGTKYTNDYLVHDGGDYLPDEFATEAVVISALTEVGTYRDTPTGRKQWGDFTVHSQRVDTRLNIRETSVYDTFDEGDDPIDEESQYQREIHEQANDNNSGFYTPTKDENKRSQKHTTEGLLFSIFSTTSAAPTHDIAEEAWLIRYYAEMTPESEAVGALEYKGRVVLVDRFSHYTPQYDVYEIGTSWGGMHFQTTQTFPYTLSGEGAHEWAIHYEPYDGTLEAPKTTVQTGDGVKDPGGVALEVSDGSQDRATSESLKRLADEIAPDLMPKNMLDALGKALPHRALKDGIDLLASGYVDSAAEFYEDRANFKDHGVENPTSTALQATAGRELGGEDFSDAFEGKDKYGEDLGWLSRTGRGIRGAATALLSAFGTATGAKQAFKRAFRQLDDTVDTATTVTRKLDTADAADPVRVDAPRGVDAPRVKPDADGRLPILNNPKCFAPETLVATPEGQRPIGEIRQGDAVLAFDHGVGEWREKRVEKFHENIYDGPLFSIHTDNGLVRTTINHPFWVLNGFDLDERQTPRELAENEDQGLSLPGRWVNSHELRCGDVLIGQDGQQQVVLRVEQEYVQAFLVHNLTISEDHTFAVGADGVLVHNTGGCPEIDQPYKRPTGATTPAQRAAVQGQPCVKCGNTTGKQVAGHKKALVEEYYETGGIDRARMRSLDAVQPECPTCSASEGGRMSHFSKKMKDSLGL